MLQEFTVPEPDQIKGRNVILLDDVVTSGATLKECSSVLYKTGVKLVIGLALGKTIRKNLTVV
jgi:competence protein ComFC